jgi:hypothetical protein
VGGRLEFLQAGDVIVGEEAAEVADGFGDTAPIMQSSVFSAIVSRGQERDEGGLDTAQMVALDGDEMRGVKPLLSLTDVLRDPNPDLARLPHIDRMAEIKEDVDPGHLRGEGYGLHADEPVKDRRASYRPSYMTPLKRRAKTYIRLIVIRGVFRGSILSVSLVRI